MADKYTYINRIDSGKKDHISVWKALKKSSGSFVVVKKIKTGASDSQMLQMVNQEITNAYNHPNIVRYYGFERLMICKDCESPLDEVDSEKIIYVSSLFIGDDFNNPAKLIAKLRDAKQNGDSVSLYLKEKLSEQFRQLIDGYNDRTELSDKLLDSLIAGFNSLIEIPIYQQEIFASVELPVATKKILSTEDINKEELPKLNRLLLENTYPQEIKKSLICKNCNVTYYINKECYEKKSHPCKRKDCNGTAFFSSDSSKKNNSLYLCDTCHEKYKDVDDEDSVFSIDDLKDPKSFIVKFKNANDKFSLHLKENLDNKLLQAIKEYKIGTTPSPKLLQKIVEEFNRLFVFETIMFQEKNLDSSLFDIGDFEKPSQLIIKLRDAKQASDNVSLYLKEKLSPKFQKEIQAYQYQTQLSQEMNNGLVAEFNSLLETIFYQQEAFTSITVCEETKSALSQKDLSKEKLRRHNRLLLEAAYPQEIAKSQNLELSNETKRLLNQQKPIQKRLHRLLLEDIYHQEIVQTHRSGVIFEHHLEMEYIDGLTLKQVLGQFDRCLTLEEALPIILRIAHVLSIIHNLPNPIIHMDIKPENIIICKSGIENAGSGKNFVPALLDRQQPTSDIKIIDFGIANCYDQEMLLGTPYYAAPEMCGFKYGSSVDIYALGGVLYNLLTKVDPYHDEKDAKILFSKKISGKMPSCLSSLERWGKNLCLMCMDKNPSKRPSAMELVRIINLIIDKNYCYTYRFWQSIKAVKEQLLASAPSFQELAPNYELEKKYIMAAPKLSQTDMEPFPPDKNPPPYYIRGGMSYTWGESFKLALQTSYKRLVIIKQYPDLSELQFESLKERALSLISERLAEFGEQPLIYDWGYYQEPTKNSKCMYIVLQYQSGTNLGKLMDEKRANLDQFTDQEIKDILCGILKKLSIFHKKNLIVRTLSPNTILYDSSTKQIAFLDYMQVKDIEDSLSNISVTITSSDSAYRRPPELFIQKYDRYANSPTLDIWSVGLIGHELIGGEPVFNETKKEIKEAIDDFIYSGIKIAEESKFYEVIRKALIGSPIKRYQNASDMLKDIQKIDLT